MVDSVSVRFENGRASKECFQAFVYSGMLQFPNAVVLNAMSAKERKRMSTKERKRAEKSAKERFRVKIADNQV